MVSIKSLGTQTVEKIAVTCFSLFFQYQRKTIVVSGSYLFRRMIIRYRFLIKYVVIPTVNKRSVILSVNINSVRNIIYQVLRRIIHFRFRVFSYREKTE